MSTTATACPHCGAAPPIKRKPIFGRGSVVALILVGAVFSCIAMEKPPTPEEAAAEAERQAAGMADIKALQSAGAAVVGMRAVNSYEVSGFNSSLDLHLGTLSASQADTMAGAFCLQGINGLSLNQRWNLRVYLVDGKLAAQCRILR